MAWYTRAEERLVKLLMEDWQRRGANLLHLGLHSPILPEFFWDSGFDVTVCEEKQNAIEKSHERSGPRIAYQLGKAEYLPFDNDSFEYAFFSLYAQRNYVNEYGIPSCLQGNDNISADTLFTEKILHELCRVARLGVVLVAKNSFSLCRAKHLGKKYNPFFLWKHSKGYCPKGRVRFASTGFMPRFAPSKLNFMNNAISFCPFGALIGYHLQFNAPTVTGIGDFIRQEKQKFEQTPLIQRNSVNKM